VVKQELTTNVVAGYVSHSIVIIGRIYACARIEYMPVHELIHFVIIESTIKISGIVYLVMFVMSVLKELEEKVAVLYKIKSTTVCHLCLGR
jgi:hypothetical protein